MSQRQESKSGFPVSQRVRRTAAALAVLGFLPGAIARAQSPPLELRQGDRIVLLGNTTAERLQQYNNFETLLMARFPDLDLVVRNLGWSGDTITLQPRPLNFGDAADASARPEAGRHPRVLRLERVVRRRGRPARLREEPRRVPRRAAAGQVQRARHAASRADLAARPRAAPAPRVLCRRGGQGPRACPLHRDDARGGGPPPRDVRRSVHADQGPDGPCRRAAHHQRHSRERIGRPDRRRAAHGRPRPHASWQPAARADPGAAGAAARADSGQEPAVLLPLAAGQRRVRRRPAPRTVRRRELPARDAAARRDGRRTRSSASGHRRRRCAKADRREPGNERVRTRRAFAPLARGTLAAVLLTARQAAAPAQEPNLGGGIDLAAEDPAIALARLHPAPGYEINLFASELEFPDAGRTRWR